MSKTLKVCLLSSALSLTAISASFADDAAPAAPTPPPEVKISGFIDAGITINTDSPKDKENFGNPFNDRSNRPILNQAVLTVSKDLDTATDYAVGFKLQGMYGSDARLTHFLGIANHSINERNQIDLVEANVSIHTPWIGAGGMDIKAGFFPTPLGMEVIDPNGNTFYSHSYLFTFGLPLKHTGILTTTHANSMLDVYFGIDTGTNTTFGKTGDNNGALGGILGFGFNGLLGGKGTLLALSHMAPDNPRGVPGIRPSHDMRYYNDILFTYKASDKLTLVSELNYVKDDGFSASAYGAVQYVMYALSDALSVNGRAEVWRDNNGFFVAEFPGNFDAINLQLGHGLPTGAFGVGKATYGELTVGVTYKPTIAGVPLSFALRPELRYDRALSSGVRPYNDLTSRGQFTAAIDLIAKF